jgi:uncharacterized protein with HEPN domain
MSRHSETVYLQHIFEAANKIIDLTQRGGRDLYDSDYAIADAIVRELLVVGEAARNLSKEYKDGQPQIPWKEVVGMRDWLVHGYAEIDWDKVWNTAINDIPELKEKIIRLI